MHRCTWRAWYAIPRCNGVVAGSWRYVVPLTEAAIPSPHRHPESLPTPSDYREAIVALPLSFSSLNPLLRSFFFSPANDQFNANFEMSPIFYVWNNYETIGLSEVISQIIKERRAGILYWEEGKMRQFWIFINLRIFIFTFFFLFFFLIITRLVYYRVGELEFIGDWKKG